MLLLTATTDKIQLVTSAAVTVDVHASWMDHTLATDNVEGGRTNTAITTATTTDIVPVPGSGVTKNVKTLHIRNKHASTQVDVTVLFDQNGTDFELFKATLRAGETLEYVEGIGFFVTASAIALFKETRRVTSDVINATTSFADITGLTFAVVAGKQYSFHGFLMHNENATTTGARWGIGGVAMTAMRMGTLGVAVYTSVDAVTARGGALATAVDTSPAGATGVGTTQVNTDIINGWFNPSASGTLAFRFQSEVAVAAGVTVKAGSWVEVEETVN
jgi:hypothetical protein